MRFIRSTTLLTLGIVVSICTIALPFGINPRNQGTEPPQTGDQKSQDPKNPKDPKNPTGPTDPNKQDPNSPKPSVPPLNSKKPTVPPKTKNSQEKEEEDPKNARSGKKVGANTFLDLNAKPVLFESGVFEGLEPYGYSFFSSARSAVELRRQIQFNPGTLQDPEAVEALKDLSGPATMSFFNVSLPAPDRYQLGPGDKLTIRVSSPTAEPQDQKATVDSRGNLQIPLLPNAITVRGQTVMGVENLIKERLRRVIKGAEVTVTLSELRTMSVSIVGEVVAQGNYQVPSVMTLFNALYMAGGPTINGSMRNIQLKRQNGDTKIVDLYKFIQQGDSSQDFPLQPGDLILVPIAAHRVGITGEVARPGVYETTGKERLKDAINYAGGALPTAVVDRVSVLSVSAGLEREVLSLNLTSPDPAQNPVLKDFDRVELFGVREEVSNAVSVEGAVDQPRIFPFNRGMRVSDLLLKARGLLPDAHSLRADLFRTNKDGTFKLIQVNLQSAIAKLPEADAVLEPRDRLVVYFEKEVTWVGERRVYVLGAVQKPDTYYRADGMTVTDLILQSGGLLPSASTDTIFVRRKKRDGTEGELIKVHLEAVKAGTEKDVVLQDEDLVTIFVVSDARYIPEQKVRINGGVLRPGTFTRSENLTLRDLIQLSGGLVPNVGGEIQLSHARVAEGTPYEKFTLEEVITGRVNPLLQDGDVVNLPLDASILLKPITVSITGRVKHPGTYAIIRSTEKITDLIARAGGFVTDSWPEGAQFSRDPKLLATASQDRLTPRVQDLLKVIQEQEYIRALAKSDIDKLRALNATNASPLNALTGTLVPGLGGASSSTSAPGSESKLLQRESVTPARPLSSDELETSGNVPVRIDRAIKDPNSPDNLILKDGDVIEIPEKPNTVALKGAVSVPGTLLFEPNKTLKFYLDRVGGYSADADQREVLVIRATGTITRAKMGTKIELGDMIYVPTKVMVARIGDSASSFDSIVKTVTNAGLLIAILSRL